MTVGDSHRTDLAEIRHGGPDGAQYNVRNFWSPRAPPKRRQGPPKYKKSSERVFDGDHCCLVHYGEFKKLGPGAPRPPFWRPFLITRKL